MGRHSLEDADGGDTTVLPAIRSGTARRRTLLACLGVAAALTVLLGGALWLLQRPGGPGLTAKPAFGSSGRAGTGSPDSGSATATPAGATASVGGDLVVASVTPSPVRSPSPRPKPTASATVSGSGLSVAFRDVDTWPSGYQATYTVTNHGQSATTGWSVVVTFSGAGNVQVWDADATSGTGHQMTFTAKSYNATVPAGGSVTFGMVVTGSPPPTPLSCSVNGQPC